MLDNRNEAVSRNGCTDLYSDSVLRCSPELLNLEVLLEPLEEQFNLPSVLVKVCYLLGRQVHRIGQEHELPVLLFVIVSDETQVLRIVLAALIDRQFNLCISEYVLWQTTLPLDTPVLQVRLGSDNKKGLHPQYPIKFFEVVVASVEYIVSVCLIGDFLHSLGVIDRGCGDVVEGRYLCLQVIEDMSLDTTFLLAKLRPSEHRQAERYRRRVECIHLASEPEYVRCPPLPGLRHHVESKLLKDTIVTVLVGSSQSRLGDGLSS